MGKIIVFYADQEAVNYYPHKHLLTTYGETIDAIERGDKEIHTTSICNMSFSLLEVGYKIFLRSHGKTLYIRPGMEELEKELRSGHNILRMFLSGVFNFYFEEKNGEEKE